MKTITSKAVANKLISYLYHKINLQDLVDWAENVMMVSDFEEENYEKIRYIISRLGVSDVKAFGLSWDDCEEFLNQLGFGVKIEVVAI